MAAMYFGNSTDLQYLSVLLIGLPKAIGNGSQHKSTFLCIQILGTPLSLFCVSFLSDLRKIWVLFQPCVLNLMNLNVFLVPLLVFVTVSCN